MLRLGKSEILIYGKDLRRSSVLRAETVASADDERSVLLACVAFNHVKIERFAVSSRLLSAVEHCDTFCSLRHGSKEMLCRERTI